MGVLFESPEMLEAGMNNFENELKNKAYRLQLITTPENESESGFEEDALVWLENKNGHEIRYDHEPDTSLWQRFVTGFLSIFVIEDLL
jgi:hypothetical protein